MYNTVFPLEWFRSLVCRCPLSVCSTINFNTSTPKQEAQYTALHVAVNRLQAIQLTVSLKGKKTEILFQGRASICVCQSRGGSAQSKAGWKACEMNQPQRDRWAGQGQGCYGDIRNPFLPNVPGNSGKTMGKTKRKGEAREERWVEVKCSCGKRK